MSGRIPVAPEAPAQFSVQWHTLLLDSWCPMEYKRIVQTVVETPTYLAIASKLFSEEECADIVALVAADPECGDLIRGTGGFRKGRGGAQRNGEKRRGSGRVYLAQRKIPSFSYHRFSKE
jgi:hypothetical protein